MNSWFEVGPAGTVHILGIKLVGANLENAGKLLVTLALIVVVVFFGFLLRKMTRLAFARRHRENVAFWARQGINILVALTIAVGIMSIWFDDPTRLATAVGFFSAGLAFALQKVITSLAGYLVILRGGTFNVGDRIVMGGVRGDVVALNFMQTTIMEMGQPPGEQGDEPSMWVKSRQYTGRVVTVPNSKIFDEPIYNYTRDFDYIWEELAIPIPYDADRRQAEAILLAAARRHHVAAHDLIEKDRIELERRYYSVHSFESTPKVYMHLTDNWIQMSLRFLVRAHGIRDAKDAMTREILKAFDDAGISVASATLQIVKLPPVALLRREKESGARQHFAEPA